MLPPDGCNLLEKKKRVFDRCIVYTGRENSIGFFFLYVCIYRVLCFHSLSSSRSSRDNHWHLLENVRVKSIWFLFSLWTAGRLDTLSRVADHIYTRLRRATRYEINDTVSFVNTRGSNYKTCTPFVAEIADWLHFNRSYFVEIGRKQTRENFNFRINFVPVYCAVLLTSIGLLINQLQSRAII